MIENDDGGRSANADCEDRQPPPTFAEIGPALEFCCWVVVALAPFLRWINGAAVTDDQFYIQCGLVTLATTGALGLRVYNWRWGSAERASLAMRSEEYTREPADRL